MCACRDYPPLYKPVNTWDVLNNASRWQPLVLQPANSPNALGAPYIQTHITPHVRPHECMYENCLQILLCMCVEEVARGKCNSPRTYCLSGLCCRHKFPELLDIDNDGIGLR